MILKTNRSERTNTDFEPRFSPDFAARVMREAARVRRRRSVIRAALGVAALGGVMLLIRPTQFLSQSKPAAQLASSPAVTEWSEANDSDYATDSYNAQYDPDKASAANYMFPDASSLEDFNSQLSNEQSATDYSVPTDYYNSNQ